MVYPLGEEDELIGTNGGLTHTFYNGSQGDTYVFEYMDQAGNMGSITATLPVTINRPEPLSLSYTMDIYGRVGEETMTLDSYTYDAEESFDFSTLSSSRRDMISITTNVDTRMVILNAGTTADQITSETQSDNINGVTQSGKTLTITENTEFVIGLIVSDTVENYDPEAPRVMAIPVSINNITTLGGVSIIYADLDRYSRRAYLETNGQDLTVTNSSGVGLETEAEHQQYQGYYYHDFYENGSFVFYYRAVGNTGSVTAIVNDIIEENISPTGAIRWWPYKVLDEAGTDQSTLSDSPVNYDVTAQVRFNMNVTEAALYYEDGNGYGAPVEADKASLNVTLDLVDITYSENIGNTVLLVTGENGTTYELHINEVGIIDKTPPEVTNNYVPGEPRQSVDITFTPNEAVLCSQIDYQA